MRARAKMIVKGRVCTTGCDERELCVGVRRSFTYTLPMMIKFYCSEKHNKTNWFTKIIIIIARLVNRLVGSKNLAGGSGWGA